MSTGRPDRVAPHGRGVVDAGVQDGTAQAMAETQAPWPGRDGLRITGVRAVVTAPEGVPLVVVRVDTSEPGLHGLGCATFTQRFMAVAVTVDEHVGPMLIGRHPADIEDITRMVHFSSYWRNGPVLNSALSGIDQALWDIAGKRAGMPVYELLGGRVRAAADTYLHAGGATVEETLETAGEILASGYRHVRLQVGAPGLGHYGAPGTAGGYPGRPYPDGWDVQRYLRDTPALFERARSVLGEEPGLMHDVHSRLTPKQAVALARRLEPYRLLFLEDPIAPEFYDRLPEVRAAAPMPIAAGEQLGSVTDAARLVREGGVDLLRLHVSAVGGLTPARKLVALCELAGVGTAWHSPADVSPVGAAANVALDVTTPAFQIQEGHVYGEAVHEVFPGTLRPRAGYLHPSDAPGWGIELDEVLAARYPPVTHLHERWAARVRRPDGGLEAP
ncbi:D-galactonate dehydratase family protein [Nonomuraea rosea]|uniref:D-galactonate dehydratase family protein n=1 Tax=Nonomuraea rosea TaxID=638574 RepID=A0ABP6Z612_9ACTN